ncbi:kinase-like domain-containing protein [Suillus clintonianus]|uniref:kinase-like domain-containing protein n=1 Tax=Suillus clintonianus TaxID=1904413 RepID=UPI001B86BC77|nr:kinase-like domain-containing protein [Suillus clintonianus]KAG2122939.1 kinase-like domain-containing protein [Suillus clintonianus]
MENDDPRPEDLPEDLTPFITRTTMDRVSAGGFGDVWKCNYNTDGISALVAVKAFRVSERDGLEKINRNISREIGILRILRHNNIVPLLGIATGFGPMSELRCLVSPWMPNGTLNAYLTFNHDNLTVLDRSRMLEDVSAGLCYLHSESVMHGDITGANILIDKRGHARLIDFGLSTIVQPLLGQSHLAISSVRPGAIRYAAPELVLSENAHELPVPLEKADIYSFGCIMLQVLSGRLPWSEIRGDALIIITMSQGRGPQRPDGHPAIVDLDWDFIQKCLLFEPELRPSAQEVLDFVIHRFSAPDSCSRPPDDPPDDAQDDFPGASPPGSSSDSDIVEQPPDSPSPHPDHELKTLTTMVDKFSASASASTSTSSTPAHSVSRFSYKYNYLSGEISGSSTTPGRVS